MRVKFNQAVHLKGKNGKGKDYSRGYHEVPEEHLQDKFFHKLIGAGLVEDAEAAAPVVSAESLQARQARLAEKLAARSKSSSLAGPLNPPVSADEAGGASGVGYHDEIKDEEVADADADEEFHDEIKDEEVADADADEEFHDDMDEVLEADAEDDELEVPDQVNQEPVHQHQSKKHKNKRR